MRGNLRRRRRERKILDQDLYADAILVPQARASSLLRVLATRMRCLPLFASASAKQAEALKYAPNWKQLREAREAAAKQKS